MPAKNARGKVVHCYTCGEPFKRNGVRNRFCNPACYYQWRTTQPSSNPQGSFRPVIYVDGLTVKELAAKAGVGIQAIYQRLRRGNTDLTRPRNRLDPKYDWGQW